MTLASTSARATRVLLTGFEPFGSRQENSSQVIIEALVRDWQTNPIAGVELDDIILPVVYDTSPPMLINKVDEYNPDLIISMGEADTDFFRVERRARNYDDSPFADNAGITRLNQVIIPGAAEYYPTRLPLDAILKSVKVEGQDARSSNDAGSYLCNHIFYYLMHIVNTAPAHAKTTAGFIHVPTLYSSTDPTYGVKWAKYLRSALQDSLSVKEMDVPGEDGGGAK